MAHFKQITYCQSDVSWRWYRYYRSYWRIFIRDVSIRVSLVIITISIKISLPPLPSTEYHTVYDGRKVVSSCNIIHRLYSDIQE